MRKEFLEALNDLISEYSDIDLDERISALELALYAAQEEAAEGDPDE